MALSKQLARIKTEEQALKYLRKNHPQFFEDETNRGLAAIVILELKDELADIGTLARVSIIAGVIALMYRMGSAAIKCSSTANKEGKSMGKILVEDYRKER